MYTTLHHALHSPGCPVTGLGDAMWRIEDRGLKPSSLSGLTRVLASRHSGALTSIHFAPRTLPSGRGDRSCLTDTLAALQSRPLRPACPAMHPGPSAPGRTARTACAIGPVIGLQTCQDAREPKHKRHRRHADARKRQAHSPTHKVFNSRQGPGHTGKDLTVVTRPHSTLVVRHHTGVGRGEACQPAHVRSLRTANPTLWGGPSSTKSRSATRAAIVCERCPTLRCCLITR